MIGLLRSNGPRPMTLTSDQELWAMALHVEREHGAEGPAFIAEQIERNALAGEPAGVNLWRDVARRFDQLVKTKCRQ